MNAAIDQLASTKQAFTASFFATGPDDQALGQFALARLPERLLRAVFAQHNRQVSQIVKAVPSQRGELQQVLSKLRIPTYEEFQARLADKDQKAGVAAEYRKIRDFEIYRSWVLSQAPIATIFRETFFRSQYPAYAPKRDRRRHTFIVGKSGSGKSEVLKLLALATKMKAAGELRRDCSLVLIDPHGDLAEQLARQQCYAADFRERPNDPDLIYLDPFLGSSHGQYPTLNPLDVARRSYSSLQLEKIAQQLARIFESLVTRDQQGLTLNMETILVPCLNVLLRRPGSTFHDLLRFMASAEENADLVALGQQLSNPAQRSFFQSSFHDARFKVTKGALATKIQSLLNNQAFANFLAQPRNTLDLGTALENGKTVILNCAIGKSGGQVAEALGRFFVGMLLGVAFNRAESGHAKRTPIWLVVDEAGAFIDDQVQIILNQARKYGLHLTLATQVVGAGMSRHLTRSILGNTAVQMIGMAGADSRAQMAKEMCVRAEFFKDLAVGEFAVKTGTTPPIRVQMSAKHLGRRTTMKPAEWQALRDYQLDHYYRPLETAASTAVSTAPNEQQENHALCEDILAAEPGATPAAPPDTSPALDAENPFADLES